MNSENNFAGDKRHKSKITIAGKLVLVAKVIKIT